MDVQRGGLSSYSENLVKELLKLGGKGINYKLIHTRKKYTTIPNVQEIIMPFSGTIPRKFLTGFMTLPLITNNLDILHDTAQISPFFYKTKLKKILTIHDLSPIIYPKEQTLISVLLHKHFIKRVIESCDAIITVSRNTKNELKNLLNIDSNKIHVIYNGKSEVFKHEININKTILTRYGLRDTCFILYVGTLEPRKNIPTLIKAFYEIKKNSGLKHRLVIVGKKGWKYQEIFSTVKNLKLEQEVIFTGYVTEEELSALYNAADLFVYPSLYEGFGFPPLEAMACGTPVITSNTSSLPEVVGDAGIMVTPYDVDGLAKSMYNVLTNNGLRENMVKMGLKRAKLFCWEKTAKETLEVYEEVYNGL